ncbi:MAG: flagellar protein FlaG [Deltaproteobacteria bacterium]|nr:flagellar protein FlaG [Deltaproteobacteria bacterium]
MERISPIKLQEIRGAETVLANQNRETATKRAPGGPDKVERGNQVKIERVAQAMENYVKSIQRELKIQVHNGTGDIMVKVISKESGQVIREIPPEELLNLAAKMEAMTGALFNENV